MKLKDPVLAALVGLVVVAALAAGWFGFAWLSAAGDSDLSYARERDTVLEVAADGLTTLHSVDHRTATRDVGRWLNATVGELRADLDADRADQVKQVRKTKTVTTAQVVQAAVTNLDDLRGMSRLIAVVDVRVTRGNGEPSTHRRRMNVELLRSPDGWKISSVEAAV